MVPVEQAVAALAANQIGTTEVALDGRRESVRTMETNQGNLLADSLLFAASERAAAFGVPAPDVAIQNGGGMRADSILPAGPVSELNTFQIAAFANFVSVVLDVSAAKLKQLLEHGVSGVETGEGRFAQVGGLEFSYDPAAPAQQVDDDGNVTSPGTRVVEVNLDDGTPLVAGGAVVSGAPSVAVATIDFLAGGGDGYPYAGAPFTNLGVTYQQALSEYISGPAPALGGQITAAQYPEGGEGRITELP